MGSTPDPTSLEALLSAAARGESVPGEVVRLLRPTGVMGALSQMPLTEVLQNMDFGKRSVRVDIWVDGAQGSVHVHDGQIVHAVASTSDASGAGNTEGESAVLEMCRRPVGFFHITYAREPVERNVHRPTTFVLLEALRVIDEATQRATSAAPAAIDLGGPSTMSTMSTGSTGLFEKDPWGEPSEAFLPQDEPAAASLNDPSAVVDIEVAAEALVGALPAHALQQHPRFRIGAVINVFFGEHMGSMLLEDLGRGGAFLRSDAQLPKGGVLTLRLPATSGALDVPGRIVHVLDKAAAASVGREAGVGVRFEDLTPDLTKRLGAFIDGIAAERERQSGGVAPTSREKLLGLLAESEFLVAAGDLESAKRVLSQAQGLAPEDDEVRKKLISVNESIDAAQAYSYLESAMRGGPQAVELARRATQLRPVRDVLLRSLAVFARGGAHDEVADVAEQLLELDPDDEGALRTLLDANVAMQRWPVAVRAAESLARLRPQDEQVQATLQRVVAMARKPRD